MKYVFFVGGIFWFSFQFFSTNGLVELTNLQCTSYDKTYSDFEYCYIKAINRTYKYVSIKAKLFQVPINNVTIRIETMRKANGYRPTVYNTEFDACRFMRMRKNVLINFFFSFIENYTNMNHTCPYDHDIILEKLDLNFLNNQAAGVLPISEGEYALYTTWYTYNIPRAHVRAYGRLKYTKS